MAKKGLGKGLGTLFDDDFNEEITSSTPIEKRDVEQISISLIEPNKDQPRRAFDKEKLDALSQSISEHGLIQPIVVVNAPNGMYKIVAGERRWRAARMAGLKEIPVIVRDYDEMRAAEIALVENLQREDLNPVEEALGYRSLMDEYGMTQDAVSKKIGKSRSAVANSLRLLALDENIQDALINGLISSGHARAILSLENADKRNELLSLIIDKELNVRQAETEARKLMKEKKKPPKKEHDAYDIQIEDIQNKLSSNLGTKVKITNGAKKGKIEIEYYGNDDLERILAMIGG